jgi:hypothetical protein
MAVANWLFILLDTSFGAWISLSNCSLHRSLSPITIARTSANVSSEPERPAEQAVV